MKFFTLLVSVTFLAVGSAFPIWLPLPQTDNHLHLAPAAPPAPTPAAKAALTTQLVGFVSTPLAPAAPSILAETYFYEGQYVRRGQVLAKLKVRGSGAVAYLNAPHDGVLSRALVSAGELLTPQTPLTTLTDQTRPRLRLAAVPTRALHPGDSVQVRLVTGSAPVRGAVLRWDAPQGAAPELLLQLRKSVTGATVGSALALQSPIPGAARKATAGAEKTAANGGRRLGYSLAVAQE